MTCEIDLRPGGAFRFVNDGHAPPFSGSYVPIESAGRALRWNPDGTPDTNGEVEIATPAMENFLGMGVTESGAVLIATSLPDFDGLQWTIRRLTP